MQELAIEIGNVKNNCMDIEDILCQAARVRGVEVEALCEVIRRNIQNVFFKGRSSIGITPSSK